jgi:hypothetical protein
MSDNPHGQSGGFNNPGTINNSGGNRDRPKHGGANPDYARWSAGLTQPIDLT